MCKPPTHPTIFGKLFLIDTKMVLQTFLHGQMTEQIALEVRPKNGGKLQKSAPLKIIWLIAPLGDQKNGPTLNLRATLFRWKN